MEDNPNYKSDLYSKFKDIGLLDNMKAQMRYKLLEKLQAANNKPINENKNDSLLIKIINSLISDYLKTNNLHYSLAVFLPEIRQETLKSEEIIEILNFSKENLNNKGLLEFLIDSFMVKKTRNWEKMNISTQTENYESIVGLESRLNGVDEEYKKKIVAIESILPKTLEEKFIVYKKDLEKRLKLEMQAEVTRIREFEFSLIRIEESEKYKTRMEEYREELERLHQDRLNKLRTREKETIDKCNERLRFIEAANHDHRQRLLKDFEMLKMREDDLDKNRILADEGIKLEKAKLERLEKEYKGKLQELEELKKGSIAKYDHEVAYNKLNLIKEVEEDRLSNYQKTKQLDEELLKLNKMKDTIATYSQQNSTLSKENAKLVEELQVLRQKKKELSSDIEQIKEQNRLLGFTSQRDQEHIKQCELQLNALQEEKERLKASLMEKQGILEDYMTMNKEILKKNHSEIAKYQETIEDLKKKLEIFKQDVKENQSHKANEGTSVIISPDDFKLKLKEKDNLKKKLMEELIKMSDNEI